MLVQTQSLVLKIIKYQDNKAICHLLTQQIGRCGVMIYLSKKNKYNLFFQPANFLNISFDFNEQRKLYTIKEAEWHYVYKNTQIEIYRTCIAQFITEMVFLCITHSEKNDYVYTFIEEYLLLNENIEPNRLTNFPLMFLFYFIKLLGHEMSVTTITEIYNTHNIEDTDLNEVLMLIVEIKTISTIHEFLDYPFLSQKKQKLFYNLLLHYQYFLPGFSIPKSLSIIREILN